MKSSDFGSPPPPPSLPPQEPEPSPEFLRAVALERAFAASLQSRRPYGTWGIIAVCGAAFLLQLATGVDDGAFVRLGMNLGVAVRAGQIWRLWSCTFLHGGWMHIGMNMWALWVLGPFIERIVGTPRFVVLYGVAGLVGSMASAWLHPTQTSVGASGAIWGLMGAAMGLALRPQGLLPPLTAHNMKRRLIQPLLVNVAISFIPGVDAFAHFGGGTAGFLLVLVGGATAGARASWAGEQESTGWRVLWWLLAAVVALAMLLSIGDAALRAMLVASES